MEDLDIVMVVRPEANGFVKFVSDGTGFVESGKVGSHFLEGHAEGVRRSFPVGTIGFVRKATDDSGVVVEFFLEEGGSHFCLFGNDLEHEEMKKSFFVVNKMTREQYQKAVKAHAISAELAREETSAS